MEDEKDFKTDEWKLYERGKSYNLAMGLYEDTEKNYDFYHGKQWNNAKLGNVQPITLNVIRPIVKYKVGVLNSYDYQIVFNPNVYENYEQGQNLKNICKSLNKFTNRLWELEQVNIKVREILKDACINAEGIAHAYEVDEEIKTEVIDKTNVCYGDESNDNIQEQPYILITYRRTVESVKEEARQNGMSEDEINKITMDSDYEEQSGRESRIDEISPMCLVILKYYKKNGTVWIKKSTKTATIMKDADTKLKLYPVAHMVWEDVKGYARGTGEVKYIIPNQIEINKTATRRTIAVQMCAFPKLVANKKYISNISSLNKVGTTILVDEMSADDVSKVVNYLRPTTMSVDALNLQQELMKDTQDLAGAGDTLNGNVDPTQASGKAILAVQQAGQQPLKEQLEKFKTFLEDLARIYFDMLQTYSKNGITATQEESNPETGETIETPYVISKEELSNAKLNVKIDISPNSSYDKFAREQSIENLFLSGNITLEEYAKALPIDAVMDKTTIDNIIRDRQERNKKLMEMQKEANLLNSAMNQAMEMQGGGENEMSSMPTSGINGQGSQEQPNEIAM
jgi:hypothetical protein